MKIQDINFSVTDWEGVASTEHPGETGMALWRTVQMGDIRLRMVEYSPGYLADHWCTKGHVVLVLEGELITQLRDGRKSTLREGMTYVVRDGGEPHKSMTETGARLFIVD